MKELFKNILNEYEVAYGEPFANHHIGILLRKTIPDSIAQIIDESRYKVQGSPGKGNWTSSPWIAIFDILITTTAQAGYYPVFLFKDDMSGFYLSLNQGVTELKEKYKKDTKQVLKLKSDDFRAQIDLSGTNFSEAPIKLKTNKGSKSPLPGLYEAGNIISKYYSAYNLPEDIQLQSDINEILKIYEALSYNEGLPSTPAERENDEAYFGFEDLRKIRFHKRIERNVYLSKKVKEAQGYVCKACRINFEECYGVLGKQFIEAHHLKPISKMIGEKIQLDVKKDFVVLCSNCHSMIHRYHDPSDIEGFKNLINSK